MALANSYANEAELVTIDWLTKSSVPMAELTSVLESYSELATAIRMSSSRRGGKCSEYANEIISIFGGSTASDSKKGGKYTS